MMLVGADNKGQTHLGRLRGHAGEGVDTDAIMAMTRR